MFYTINVMLYYLQCNLNERNNLNSNHKWKYIKFCSPITTFFCKDQVINLLHEKFLVRLKQSFSKERELTQNLIEITDFISAGM